MINTIFYEFILIAMILFSPDAKDGKFQLTEKSGEKHEISFQRADDSANIIEGAHQYFVYIDEDNLSDIMFAFIDNGLYRAFPDANEEDIDNTFELDIIGFLMKFDHDKLLTKKQSFKTSDKSDTIVIDPKKDSLVLTLKKAKTKIVVDKNLLK